jgi:7-carboxy-7-deazaguanine synthase
VPARNTVFLSMALAWAETLGARDLFYGANALDYSGYPDCRPPFVEAFERLANLGTKEGTEAAEPWFRVHAPFLSMTKGAIVRRAAELGVDLSRTVSCYDPSPSGEPCARCDACVLRAKGFAEAGLPDPALAPAKAAPAAIVVNEIFHSIQGESTRAGVPCVFVRLTACDLRCTWCDTEYAFHEGTKREVADVVAEVAATGCDVVEVTGGEPLLQAGVHGLMAELLALGKTVMIETGGHRDISGLDPRVIRIVDVKTPSSGESHRVRTENFAHLKSSDELKFVVQDRADFDWSLGMIARHRLAGKCPLLFSPVAGTLDPAELAAWMIEKGVRGRLQLQLHKILWPEAVRGV